MATSDYKDTVVRGWKSPKGILGRIEGLVLLCAVLFAFTFFGGLYRRRSRSSLLKASLWLVNTVIYTIVAYTLGLMQAFHFRNELFGLWAVLLLLVFLNSDSFMAYSLEDNKQWKRYAAHFFLLSSFVSLILANQTEEFRGPVVLLYILVLLKQAERLVAVTLANEKDGLPEADKIVYDYMEHVLESGSEDWLDPVEMIGCPYLVNAGDGSVTMCAPDYRWRIDTSSPKVITIGKVWQCKGKVLQPVLGKEEPLKDVCLSFALFKLLKRRFSGYPLSESRHPKTRAFVLQGLLSTENDHERIFRILAVELSFLFDFFYTRYHSFFYAGFFHIIVWMLILAPVIWLIPKTFKDYRNPDTKHHLNFTTHGKNIDAVITFALVLIILIVEFMQLWISMISDWAKVWLLCKYIEKPSWQNSYCMEKFVGFFCHQKSWFRPWQNKISQYSLLDSFDHTPLNLLSRVTFGLIDKERKGQKSSPAINLPTQVKRAIIHSLIINNGQLTNGASSLQQNGVSESLSWACQQKTQTHTILVWHIATTLCEIAPVSAVQTRQDELNEHRTVACSLSKYCAYLVAFAPELLPEHSYCTQNIFDMVVSETRFFLKGMESVESRYHMMMRAAVVDPDGITIIQKGSKLGKQLMDEIEDGRVRWKLLAEFWAEMMIFVAPSDDATAHLEHLAQGGEFVTQIWALLSHAGILARPEPTLEHIV